jgi:hypothetical protein
MRFTIRDLLWLTVVVAMGVAWWINRTLLISEYDAALRFEHQKRLEAEETLIDRVRSKSFIESQLELREKAPDLIF